MNGGVAVGRLAEARKGGKGRVDSVDRVERLGGVVVTGTGVLFFPFAVCFRVCICGLVFRVFGTNHRANEF